MKTRLQRIRREYEYRCDHYATALRAYADEMKQLERTIGPEKVREHSQYFHALRTNLFLESIRAPVPDRDAD